MSKTVLMVLTSHDTLGESGHPTGWWLEEMAAPYLLFRDAGLDVTVATPQGGKAPLDPRSTLDEAQNEWTRRFMQDKEAQDAVNDTIPVDMVRAEDYDVLFFPGGHGPMFDLAEDESVADMITDFILEKKPVAAVCHGPAALLSAMDGNGNPVLAKKRVTGFSNAEETAIALHEVVPFLLEDALKEKGARYECGPEWQAHVVEDGLLLTGQNPASSLPLAEAVLKRLGVNYVRK
ncbi:type 1 glutamine amidotransferase domain-containing protein [Desulfovibrio mangrovi]|uniref:type 1 glutamine amidotransferase domain-containing protein n=1 Tax=Desulfovibrio mangrovi TaxID=2976983 RepID=UPI0022453D9A|nr:type 1 glutamine amidotransferase domain-containing protein [Desulfovibrio mangrovi]UZP68241.1 type 1 glutamine amidotransferase domain-containing protein [Desulfovibrio mangrovi]